MARVEFTKNIHQQYIEFGFNSSFETKRLRSLSNRFGLLGFDIGRFEHERNTNAYKREFLDDKPFSSPMVYWVSPAGKLNTQFYSDSLFSIDQGINPQERDGKSLAGFLELENLINKISKETLDDRVVFWYSPPGPAGSKPPFDEINYDSGRIYLSIVSNNNIAINFDIKVLEENFPILELLNSLSGKKYNQSRQYLTDPFDSNMNFQQFVYFINKSPYGDKILYLSKRFSEESQEHRLKDIIFNISNELFTNSVGDQIKKLDFLSYRMKHFVYQPVGDMTTNAMEKYTTAFASTYYWMLVQEAKKNNGQVVLYGCSTSGKRIIGESGFNEIIESTGFNSIFDTGFRTSQNSKVEDYKNDPNLCKCGKPDKAHFHCLKDLGNNKKCEHAIIVGEGTAVCPDCGNKAKCLEIKN